MGFKRIVCEFAGGILFASLLGACALLIDKILKTYRLVSGEPLFIFLVILGLPISCFLGFVAADRIFFGVKSVAKVRLLMAVVASGIFGGLGCAVVLDYIRVAYFAKASLLMIVIVVVSLILYNLFNVANAFK